MADATKETPGPEGTENTEEMPLPGRSSDASAAGDLDGSSPASGELDVAQLAEQVAQTLEPRLRETLRPEIERTVQSVKDVRLKRFDDLDPDDIRLVADALKRNDNDPDAAAKDLAIEAILAERRSQSAQPDGDSQPPATHSQPDSGLSEEDARARAKSILDRSGLSEEEAKEVVAEWSGRSYGSDTEMFDDLTAIAIEKGRSSPASSEEEPSSPDTSPVLPSGGSPLGGGDEETQQAILQLYGELDELMVNPTKTRERRMEIKSQLRDLGEDIE